MRIVYIPERIEIGLDKETRELVTRILDRRDNDMQKQVDDLQKELDEVTAGLNKTTGENPDPNPTN